MKLIILSITTYKEKDAIINALSEEGIVTFSVNGLLSPKSKNIILSTPLVIADVKMKEGKYKYLICESSSLILSPYSSSDSLTKMAAIAMVGEATNKMLQDEEKVMMYPLLEKAIKAFKDNIINPYQILITYLGEVLRIAGYHFDINKCVFCQTKSNIVNFSFREGGFVCKDCYEFEDDYRFNKEQMLLIRQLLGTNNFDTGIDIDENNGYTILKEMVTFIYEGLGIKLNNFSLLS